MAIRASDGAKKNTKKHPHDYIHTFNFRLGKASKLPFCETSLKLWYETSGQCSKSVSSCQVVAIIWTPNLCAAQYVNIMFNPMGLAGEQRKESQLLQMLSRVSIWPTLNIIFKEMSTVSRGSRLLNHCYSCCGHCHCHCLFCSPGQVSSSPRSIIGEVTGL